MTWGWSSRGQASVAVGGSRGTPDEAKIAHAWPSYEAKYLAQRLATKTGKYDNGGLNDLETHVYLDKVAEDYKTEADECLRKEFYDWLEGKHAANGEPLFYDNKKPGNPSRLKVIRDGNGSKVADKWDDTLDGQWNPTWWGQHALTHLPGVREHLRENEKQKMQADLQMNLLAEFGPQNLEQAWMYFKHWVKGRPVGTDECMQGMTNETFSDGSLNTEKDNIVRSAFGNMPGKGFPTIKPVPNPPPESTEYTKSPSSGATAAAAVAGAAAAGAGPVGTAATALAAARAAAEAAIATAQANAQAQADAQAQVESPYDQERANFYAKLRRFQTLVNARRDIDAAAQQAASQGNVAQAQSNMTTEQPDLGEIWDFFKNNVDFSVNDDLEREFADLEAQIAAADATPAANAAPVDNDDLDVSALLAELDANIVATAADNVATAAAAAADATPAAIAAVRRSSRPPKPRSDLSAFAFE
jgi:hypothetical protein